MENKQNGNGFSQDSSIMNNSSENKDIIISSDKYYCGLTNQGNLIDLFKGLLAT
jgi:hypothetical protein